jgi:hypothetical protein
MRAYKQEPEADLEERLAEDERFVVLTISELAAFANGLNEALSAVDDWEFQTRVGITPDEAVTLIRSVQRTLQEGSPFE